MQLTLRETGSSATSPQHSIISTSIIRATRLDWDTTESFAPCLPYPFPPPPSLTDRSPFRHPSRSMYDPPTPPSVPPSIQTGVAFRGISNYKRVFSTLRFFRQSFMNDSSTTFRLTYDWSKQQVRITWNMVLQLKARQRPIHVDAISAYHINSDGLAYRHELETVVVNGTPVEPPYAYAWINLPAWVSRGAKAGAGGGPAMPAPNGIITSPQFDFDFDLNFKGFSTPVEPEASAGSLLAAARTDPELRGDFMSALSVLMAAEGADSLGGGGGGGVEEGGGGMAAAAESDEATAVAETPKKEARTIKGKKKDGWFGLQGKLECDTSFDCTGGMVCCDFVLVKVCCSNGIRQPKFGDLVPSLVPIPGRGRNENDTPAKKRTPPRPRNGGGGW